jgi:hypothetical protein
MGTKRELSDNQHWLHTVSEVGYQMRLNGSEYMGSISISIVISIISTPTTPTNLTPPHPKPNK